MWSAEDQRASMRGMLSCALRLLLFFLHPVIKQGTHIFEYGSERPHLQGYHSGFFRRSCLDFESPLPPLRPDPLSAKTTAGRRRSGSTHSAMSLSVGQVTGSYLFRMQVFIGTSFIHRQVVHYGESVVK